MSKNKHRIVIVGFGGMGNWHRELIESGIEGLELAGMYDIKEERQQAARDLGYRAYDSFEDVLADESVDMILTSTPNDCHKPLAVAALHAGKNVVSEKPVTLSSGDLQEMIDAANKSGKIFTVHQNRRWDEDFLTMKKIYDEGLLGDVFNIESRVHGSRGIPGDWRGKKEHGGGMMLDWGVHILDQMLLFVPEKVKTVYCKVNHVTNYEVDDGFTMILTFESGKTALLEVGTSNFIELPRWYMLGENGSAARAVWCASKAGTKTTQFRSKRRQALPKPWRRAPTRPLKRKTSYRLNPTSKISTATSWRRLTAKKRSLSVTISSCA